MSQLRKLRISRTCTGARIEIKQIWNSHLYIAPTQVCVLKLPSQYDCMQRPKVAPLQVCVD